MARSHSVKNQWKVLEVFTAVVIMLISMLIVLVDESQSASLGTQVKVTQQALAGPHLQRESQNQDDEEVQLQEKSGLQPSIGAQDLKAAQTSLLLVTILKQMCQPSSAPTFIVDGAMVSLAVTVTVQSQAEMACSLINPEGKSEYPSETGTGTTRWFVTRPLGGRWVVEYNGQENYNISVQGESPLDLEITLYEIDTVTGVSELVQISPTAGRSTRIILDIVGAELMGVLFNISLVTSDGESLASDWVRHTGGPNDPQYATTLTWPAESVYILAVGKESSGDKFQRQSPYTFVPKLIDLQLLGDPGTSVMHSSVPLTIRYVVTNYGQSDTLLLSTLVDNKVFEANVSPSKIVLGKGSSFTGSVTVIVDKSTLASAETGLLQVKLKSSSNPHETQKVTRLLTVDGPQVDDKPPSCHVISITSNCSASAGPGGRRSKCSKGQWTVHAWVTDDVSGLASVSFSDVSVSDEYVVEPIIKGHATKEVPVFYRTTCCKKSITLLTSDEAGHADSCEFLLDSMGVTTGSVSQGKVSTNTKQSLTMTLLPVQRSSRASSTTRFGLTLQGKTTIVPPTDLEGTTYSPLLLIANSQLEGVTREQTKETWEDYSTVKVAAVALGSVGGVAGLSVIILCSIYCLRYRRYRRRESRDDEDNLRNSTRSTISRTSDFRCSLPSRPSRRGL